MMGTFAVLDNNNVVENIIVADTIDIAQELTGQTCVEYTEDDVVYPGETYNPKKKTFSIPAPAVIDPALLENIPAPTAPTQTTKA